MTIRVTAELRSSDRRQFGDKVIAGAKPKMRRDAEIVGEAMVEEGTKLIERHFVTDRPPHRRRTPGSIRLVNALKYRVEETPTTVTAVLTTKRGISSAKVASLNAGSDAHEIAASGDNLYFPTTRGLSGRAKQIRNAYGRNTRKPAWVSHPGTTGRRFMENARRNAVRRLKR